MIAPEPFFEPRGTPFSEFHRIRALTDLGHQVDLVTYPFGEDVTMPGLRLFRCLRPPSSAASGSGPPPPNFPPTRCWACPRRGAPPPPASARGPPAGGPGPLL